MREVSRYYDTAVFQFCGHCQGPLNTDGLCPECDATQIEEEQDESIPRQHSDKPLNFNSEPGPLYESDFGGDDQDEQELDEDYLH